jgi:hypothetical protein
MLAYKVVLIDIVQPHGLQSQLIPREVVEVVPSDCVNVCLSDFFGKLSLMFGQKCKKILISQEMILLDDLSIDVRRP